MHLQYLDMVEKRLCKRGAIKGLDLDAVRTSSGGGDSRSSFIKLANLPNISMSSLHPAGIPGFTTSISMSSKSSLVVSLANLRMVSNRGNASDLNSYSLIFSTLDLNMMRYRGSHIGNIVFAHTNQDL